MGVGDLSVGRRVRAMWEAFHGRSKAYATAMEAADDGALAAALARNVWRGAEPPGESAAALARYMRRQTTALAAQPLSSLLAGEVSFLPAGEAAR
jgi:cytochrome b pre-mRNA-processing protein 3